jgi:glutamate--cysteine ligase
MDIVLGSWAQVSAAQYLGIGRGLEKESLRVQPDAALASTAHPVGLGSALTHPHITTDFSEAQIELITGVHASAQSCIDELVQVQHYTLQAMGSEVLWASSMPCTLPADAQIPLGRYGSSNTGRLKTVYRAGLGLRYGRRMQTISGIHYNWSLPDTSSEAYFGLIRNFRRHSFVLLYLFGASPAVCSSFVQGRAHQLQAMNAKTMYLPYATSLRMGRLGYQSDAQAQLAVSYNSLQGYAASLEGALTQPYPAYAAMGVRAADGSYQQLADSLLQIENEFYGVIRPKRVIDAGERPLHALRARGVQYVEVRLLDLNPFEPIGISAQTLRFLDVFLLLCLRSESPLDSPQEIAAMSRNQQRVAERGREPGLALERAGQSVPLLDWAQAIIQAMQPLAAQLDAVYGNADYSAAVQAAERALLQPQLLPSAQVLEAITGPFAGSFLDFTAAQSLKIKQQMLALAPDAAAQSLLRQQSQDSVLAQRQLEAADNVPFEAYLEAYLSPQRLLFSADGL